MSRTPLWQASETQKEASNLSDYMAWLKENKALDFKDYESLRAWSCEDIGEFWDSIWRYFEVDEEFQGEVLEGSTMPDIHWYKGANVNYIEHLFRRKDPDQIAIHAFNEKLSAKGAGPESITWNSIERQVSALQNHLKQSGVTQGDRVAAFMPNITESTIAFMGAVSIGATWSSCSPDFGASSVVDRFSQIQPKVLIACNGYYYNGKAFDKRDIVASIVNEIPSIEQVIWVDYLEDNEPKELPKVEHYLFKNVIKQAGGNLQFTKVPFDHPIWILYSSGTTGIPKAITHGHGGVLLEHYKYMVLQNDVKPNENFFWFSTTGWMMWNYLHAAMLGDASIVLYDGSPGYPDIEILWKLAERIPIHHFGTSAPFLVACMKNGIEVGKKYDLSQLRSIGSTGSPLPPEAFQYVYDKIKKDVWLCSMSGGTDVCTAFVGSSILKPVYEGELQCRALGVDMVALSEDGKEVINEVGEMVIRKPMPSMPIYFWNDENKAKYKSSYFDVYPGIWRHGDWVSFNEDGGLKIHGRSDATLNRQGVRIGTAEIYRALNAMPAIKDGLIVNLELGGGKDYMPLFVQVNEGFELNNDLIKAIKTNIRKAYSPRHVPEEIIQIEEVPYTISGKKLESPVKKILMGGNPSKVANRDAMRNPESLEFFIDFRNKIKDKFS